MSTRAFLWILLPLLSAILAASATAKSPNVVVLLADDAGWGDYSHNGNRSVKTPNIDSIAQQGAVLDRFFVCPVCAPTRAEFLTGRYHSRSGVSGVSTGQERMSLREQTIADSFRAAGYATGAFGKWHNGSQWPYHPNARGFQEYFGYTSGHWGEYFDSPLEHNGSPVRANGYIVDWCTDRAIEFIEKNRNQPFFCYVPFTTPHSPWAVPDEYWQRFRQKEIAQPATVAENEKVDETRCALAMLENQDWNVGRILATLKRLSIEEETIVLYFSDNGPNGARWNGGMKGTKGSTDEGGIRSTCYLRFPKKIQKGTVVPKIAGAIDLLPTLTSLAGVPRVGHLPLDGMDLTRLLTNEGDPWPDRLLFSTWGPNASVRSQSHRLDSRGRLYDMSADPAQERPIENDAPEVAQKLQSALSHWKSEMSKDFAEQVPGSRGRAGVDVRPIPVGYREFPRTWLPARDATATGGIQRSATAPNSSYYVNWTALEDSIGWDVSVHESGKYRVEILYTCPLADEGSKIELSFGRSQLVGTVAPGWDPPLYTNQDTLPRPKGESKMKEFRTLELGTIELESGLGPLRLRALSIPGKSVMDLRALVLTLQP